LEKQLKNVDKENFQFRSTRNRTTVITKGMAVFQSAKYQFDANNQFYYSSYPKSEKPMKSVISHLPYNTLAEDISDVLISHVFDVTRVKQMTAT
jgi:hypothetical protein